jgi:hypothetical protein
MNEIEIKIEAQKKCCKDSKYPMFVPHNGICNKCKNQIFERISLEKCQNEVITECPYCEKSYCE